MKALLVRKRVLFVLLSVGRFEVGVANYFAVVASIGAVDGGARIDRLLPIEVVASVCAPRYPDVGAAAEAARTVADGALSSNAVLTGGPRFTGSPHGSLRPKITQRDKRALRS